MKAVERTLVRMHGLDTLRALAITSVVLYHLKIQGLLPEALAPAARMGWVGVDLFFVLSGYLIGGQLLRPYQSGARPLLKDFYARRAYRILPAFLVVLLLYLTVPVWREADGPHAVWQYATFTWNLLLLGYPESRAFSHVWSLCVEEHFYLLLPVLLLILMRKPSQRRAATTFLCIVAGGVLLRAYILHAVVLPSDDPGRAMMRYLYYPTYTRLDGLTVGVVLAAVETFRPAWWNRLRLHSRWMWAPGILLLVVALWMCGFDYPSPDLPMSLVLAFPLLACGFGLMVISAATGGSLLARRLPGAAALSSLAYSLYLTHKSVAHATHLLLPLWTAESDWKSFGMYAAACLGFAWLLYALVERPFLALRARRRAMQEASAIDREGRLDPAL